jgi:acylphosphatase
VAEGAPQACAELLSRLRGPGTPGRVDSVIEQWSAAKGVSGFLER